MGQKVALLYLVLIVIGYWAQIAELVLKRKTEGVSITMFCLFASAVLTRLISLITVAEETGSRTSLILIAGDIIIVLSNIVIILLVLKYRKASTEKGR